MKDTPNTYLRVSCLLPSIAEDVLSELTGDAECFGSEIRDEESGSQRVLFYLGISRSTDFLISRLKKLAAKDICIEEIENTDWLSAYREGLQPFAVGRRWWIDPLTGGSGPTPEGRIRLAMEPRMAFGSGSHESTRLMLEALETEPPVGLSLLDVGSGSGILSIAALLLGAESVVGFDIDLQSVLVARQLLADQEQSLSPLYYAGPISAIGTAVFDEILCNMLSKFALPLIPEIMTLLCPGGHLILSGLLNEEVREIQPGLESQGLRLSSHEHRGEWSLLRLEKQE